jgi:hypothetical protein
VLPPLLLLLLLLFRQAKVRRVCGACGSTTRQCSKTGNVPTPFTTPELQSLPPLPLLLLLLPVLLLVLLLLLLLLLLSTGERK